MGTRTVNELLPKGGYALLWRMAGAQSFMRKSEKSCYSSTSKGTSWGGWGDWASPRLGFSVLPEGGPGIDPRHAGEITSLLGKWRSVCLCLDCCSLDLDPDKWEKMDGTLWRKWWVHGRWAKSNRQEGWMQKQRNYERQQDCSERKSL